MLGDVFRSQCSASQNVIPRPAALALPRNLLEMLILGPYLRPTESETLESGTII